MTVFFWRFAPKNTVSKFPPSGGEGIGMSMTELCAGGADEVAYIRRLLKERGSLQNYESDLKRKDGDLVL